MTPWKLRRICIFSIQKSNTFLKDSPASLAPDFPGVTSGIFDDGSTTAAHNSACMGSLAWNQHVNTHSMLLFVFSLEIHDGKRALPCAIFCGHYCWRVKCRDESWCKEGNRQPAVPAAHLPVLKQPLQQSWGFWSMVERQEALYAEKKTCLLQTSESSQKMLNFLCICSFKKFIPLVLYLLRALL